MTPRSLTPATPSSTPGSPSRKTNAAAVMPTIRRRVRLRTTRLESRSRHFRARRPDARQGLAESGKSKWLIFDKHRDRTKAGIDLRPLNAMLHDSQLIDAE